MNPIRNAVVPITKSQITQCSGTVMRRSACYVCERMTQNPARVVAANGEVLYVGSDCWKRIADSGAEGVQPSWAGASRVYRAWFSPSGEVMKSAAPEESK